MKYQTLQEYADEEVAFRLRIIDQLGDDEGAFLDRNSKAKIFSRNVDETVEFFSHATKQELNFLIDSLPQVVEILPYDQAERIFNVFKAKLVEYPDLEDFPYYSYQEMLDEAEYVLELKLKKQD